MIKHKIYVKRQKRGIKGDTITPLIRRCIRAVLQAEGIVTPCEVSVLLTDDKSIQEINKTYRSVDKPTDVLSFPMQMFMEGKLIISETDPNTGLMPLGDIIISIERAEEQAREYGHNIMREFAYLAVHAVLHLLGYDHVENEDGQRKMRMREEKILDELGITR